jgi:hypothetical protein
VTNLLALFECDGILQFEAIAIQFYSVHIPCINQMNAILIPTKTQ